MSDGSSQTDVVAESVDVITGSVDWEPDDIDLVEGEPRVETGRAIGARLGRELGGVLGRRLGELVASGLGEGESPSSVLEDARRFLVEVLSTLLRDADVSAALSEIRENVLSTPEAGQEGEEETTADDEGDVMSPGDLDDLREETLRELLEVMSYSEMQSIAKEVGVKANLDTETMRERIVEQFTSELEEETTGQSDE